MKIVVINGSPKGEVSITMQYVKYMQMRFSTRSLKFCKHSVPPTKYSRYSAFATGPGMAPIPLQLITKTFGWSETGTPGIPAGRKRDQFSGGV